MFSRHAVFVLMGLLVAATSVPLLAGDWPQFLGPKRNGISAETGLQLSWGEKGPPKLWHREVGEGYSGPVVAGDRLILFHRVDDREVVECLQAADGKSIWKFSYATDYEDQLNKGNGPRATPVMTGKHVVTLGAGGWLHCLDLEKGEKIWGRNINTDYRVPPSYFGVGSSPLVEGNRLLVNVGGKEAGIVAFDLATGNELWKSTSDAASYASPVAASADGARHAVFFTRHGVVVLSPETGDVRFQMRWRARIEASVNAATPLVIGEKVFISASYDTGALLLRLRKGGAEKIWSNDEAMANHYNTCIHHQGQLYGCDGRQEAGPSFRCVNLESARVLWNRPRFGCGAMVLADGQLIVLTEKGELVAVEASAKAYRETARAQVLDDGPCRSQIALANGRLYARDQKKLVCWKLSKPG